ncbi:MAG TPA: hypothetical protein VM409_07985 [Chloroflexia bacterium]|nr:hypothetical protein [Chloroflexia bacterium]
MHKTTDLLETEKLCAEIMSSPYLWKETPPELAQLRIVLEKVNILIRQNIPPLVAEVKQLRTANKRLTMELEAASLHDKADAANIGA